MSITRLKNVTTYNTKTLVLLFSSCSLVVMSVLVILSKKKTTVYLSDLDELKYTTRVFQSDGKWGFSNNDGDILISAKYDTVYKAYGELSNILDTGNANYGCFVRYQGKWGLVDKNGREVVTPTYDNIGFYDMHYGWVKQNGFWGLIDSTGREVVSPMYDDYRIGVIESNFPLIKKNEKWGILQNSTGKEVVSPRYDSMGDIFSSSGVTWMKFNGQYGFVDTTGREIEIPGGNLVDDIKQVGGFIIHTSTGYGYADYNGDMKIPCDYEGLLAFSTGFKVMKNNRVGFVDKEGNEIIPPKYGDISLKNGNYEVGTTKGFYGLFSAKGKEILPTIFETIDESKAGYLCSLQNMCALYSPSGEELIPLGTYDEIKVEGAGYAKVKKYGLYGWYDLNNKALAIQLKFDYVWDKFESKDDIVRVRYKGEPIKIDYYGNVVEGKDMGEWFNEKVRPTVKKIENAIKDEN